MATTTFTEKMMSRFPSWMKLAKDPNSIGAQFLEVFGLTFQEFQKELDETVADFYVETAHTDMIDILYRVPLAQETILDFSGVENVRIRKKNGQDAFVYYAGSLRNFYKRTAPLPSFFEDRASGYLYLRVNLDEIEDIQNPYEVIYVNGSAQYEVELHHVWNAFDEFALLLGLNRLPGERNQSLKQRILDVFRSPGNSSNQGIANGLSRELGIPKSKVEVFSFSQLAHGGALLNPDGTPTERMVRYAKEINQTLKFTWDTFNFGEAYWFSIEKNNLGIHYLPHVWDVDLSLFKKEEFQSGVGDGDDLLVTGPTDENPTRAFKAYVGLMGYYESAEAIYPEILFRYKIYAKGKIKQEEFQEEAYRYTVKAAEVFEQEYRVEAKQEFPYIFSEKFSDSNAFASDGGKDAIHFGKSNDFLHKQTDAIMRLSLDLETVSETASNSIPELKVVWEDILGAEHNLFFQTESDFLVDRNAINGQPLVSLAYSDVFHDANGLSVGYGSMQRKLDTTLEWQTGEYETNSILVQSGGLSLNLDALAGNQN